MIDIKNNEQFINLVKRKMVDFCNNEYKLLNWTDGIDLKFNKITEDDVFVVWFCKTLQNYKCIVSTRSGDGLFVEFTYNGDNRELYRDVYKKICNTRITNEL